MGEVHFNSHAHVERDPNTAEVRQLKPISTHTLTWSVTYTCKMWYFDYKFQLTRSRGA